MNLNDMTENVLSIIYSFSSHEDKLKMVLLSKSINKELKVHREWRLYIDASCQFFLNNAFRALVLKRIYSQKQLSFVFNHFGINGRLKCFLFMHAFEFSRIDNWRMLEKITSQIIE